MLILNAEDVRRALPMAAAIGAAKRAFAALSAGLAVMPARAHIPAADGEGVTLVMPALVRGPAAEAGGEGAGAGGGGEGGGGQALAVKVVSLFAGNAARGLARLQAVVLALDPATGVPLALLEGSALTALRTAAACGVATELLAPADSRCAAILGAGVQARTQLEAVCTVRAIETVWVYDPSVASVESLIADLAGRGPIPADIRPARDARAALAEADIVCTATTSARPVFADADLKAAAHVNAIGSYQPHVQELPPDTVARAWVVVDSRDAALAETGDLIQPIRQGLFGPDHIRAELGDLVLGRPVPPRSPGQITLFKTVGLAVQDATAAQEALRRAAELGIGQRVAW
jgi:ornithine cyclodeaminase/alanine dehydrogenase-like protein (mu-crystallin family)